MGVSFPSSSAWHCSFYANVTQLHSTQFRFLCFYQHPPVSSYRTCPPFIPKLPPQTNKFNSTHTFTLSHAIWLKQMRLTPIEHDTESWTLGSSGICPIFSFFHFSFFPVFLLHFYIQSNTFSLNVQFSSSQKLHLYFR